MRFALFFVLVIFSSSCTAVNVSQYEGNTPKFHIFDYFLGQTTGWGIVQDRGGKVTREFVVHINGQMKDNNTLSLMEYFFWKDGETSQREWTIFRSDSNQFTGSAGDVIGKATGEQSGNALQWRYTIDLPVGENSVEIHFNDWMFLQHDNVLINKAKMSKFGFRVGEVTIVFLKDKTSVIGQFGVNDM